MANARKGNVLLIDTAAAFDEALRIQRIKVVNANAGTQTSTIKVGGSSGTAVWSKAVTATTEATDDLPIRISATDAAYITPGTTCTLYIYLE